MSRQTMLLLVSAIAVAPLFPLFAQVDELLIRDQPVKDVLLEFGQQAGISVVTDGEVNGTVSMVLHATTPDQALDRIVAAAGLYGRRERDVLVVSRSQVLSRGGGWTVRSNRGSLLVLLRRLAGATGTSLAFPAISDRRVSLELAAPGADAMIESVAEAVGLGLRTHPHHLELLPAPEPQARERRGLRQSAGLLPEVRVARSASGFEVAAQPGPTGAVVAAIAAELETQVLIVGELPPMRDPIALRAPDEQALSEGLAALLNLQVQREGATILVAARTAAERLRPFYRTRRIPVTPELARSLRELAGRLGGLEILGETDEALILHGTSAQLDRLQRSAAELRDPQLRRERFRYRCSFIEPAAAAEELRRIFPELSFSVAAGADGRLLLLRAPRSRHEELRHTLEILDRPPRQIRFDLCIIQYQAGHAVSHGVELDAGYDGSGLVRQTPLSGTGSFDGMLALQFDMVSRLGYRAAVAISDELSSNEARLVLDTRIRAVDGVTARLENSSTFRYRDAAAPDGSDDALTGESWFPVVREIDSGLSVELLGHTHRDRSVTVDVSIAFSRQGSDESRTGDPPPTSERAVHSRVRLQPGQSMVIGGLLHSESSRSDHRFPLLGRIPLLRTLTNRWDRRTEETELVLYLSAHPDPDEPPARRAARQLERIAAQADRRAPGDRPTAGARR